MATKKAMIDRSLFLLSEIPIATGADALKMLSDNDPFFQKASFIHQMKYLLILHVNYYNVILFKCCGSRWIVDFKKETKTYAVQHYH